MTFHYISRSKRDKILNFSGNSYDGVWSITSKNKDDHSIRMGGVRGQIPPTQKYSFEHYNQINKAKIIIFIMDTPIHDSIMHVKNDYPKLKSPGFIGRKLLPPL